MNPLNQWAVCGIDAPNLLHQAIVESHELCVLVVFEHQLARPRFGALPQKYFSAQVALQFVESFLDIGINVNLGLFFAATSVARSQALNLAHRQTTA